MMETMLNDQQKAREANLARIRALTQKTVANGCTEAEAQAAAAMIDKLLALYEVDLDEVTLQQEQEVILTTIAAAHHDVRFAALRISTFTDTKPWVQKGCICYLGFEVDVGVAEYLTLLFMRAIDREASTYTMFNAEYALMNSIGQQEMLHSFRIGCAGRLGERLIELKSKRDFAQRSSGRDLVLVKKPLVDEAFASLGLELGPAGRGVSIRNQSAYAAGRDAADKVSISQGVNGYSQKHGAIR